MAQPEVGPKGMEASIPIVMAARPAPVSPAIKAWDSEEGIPKAQAKTPQAMTPTMPAHRAFKAKPYWEPKSTMLEMVSAVSLEMKNIERTPRKLKMADMTMAGWGLMHLVDTQVAMALGASVQPLMNTTPMTKTIATPSIGTEPMISMICWMLTAKF